MKAFSWLLTIILLLLALSFALANRQSATVSLWPFDIELMAPLYLISLGTLFTGLLIGAAFGWIGTLSHRFEARRLRKDIAGLRDKIEELQHAARKHEHHPILSASNRPKLKWRFWENNL